MISPAPTVEGGTALSLPPSAGELGPARRSPIFYNGAMAVDRDLGVAVAEALRPTLGARSASGWEMLAATGVRGLRMLHESGLFRSMLLTEAHPMAFALLEENCRPYEPVGAIARAHDARRAPRGLGPFDWVDLDPYGSPAPFLAAVFDAAAPSAVIAVTATDLRVLAGADPSACRRRYGAHPVPGRLGPEGALRVLLAWLDRAAAERGGSIEPLLAYVRGHYVRAYVRRAPARPSSRRPVRLLDPEEFPGPRLPDGGPYGPLWVGPILDRRLLGSIRRPATASRPDETERWVERLREEAAVEAPFIFESNTIAKALHLPEPPPVARLVAALREVGYPTARTHVRDGGFRTEAPRREVERIARSVP